MLRDCGVSGTEKDSHNFLRLWFHAARLIMFDIKSGKSFGVGLVINISPLLGGWL